jgi:hypothetical protein
MVEVFILEEEEGDLGVGTRAGSQGAVAVTILHTKFCKRRESWSRVLMLMAL